MKKKISIFYLLILFLSFTNQAFAQYDPFEIVQESRQGMYSL